MPTRRKEASPKTLALVKKGKNVKMDDDVDRIDVYNQYDEENIEIDEEPVSIHLFFNGAATFSTMTLNRMTLITFQ